jgi:hypothetical protein
VRATDPSVTLAEVEAALRDAAAYSYVIACQGKFSVVIGSRQCWRRLPRPA